MKLTPEEIFQAVKDMGGEIAVFKVERRLLWIGPKVTRYIWEEKYRGITVTESQVAYRSARSAWFAGATEFLEGVERRKA